MSVVSAFGACVFSLLRFSGHPDEAISGSCVAFFSKARLIISSVSEPQPVLQHSLQCRVASFENRGAPCAAPFSLPKGAC